MCSARHGDLGDEPGVDKYSFFTKCRLDLQQARTTEKVWGQMMDGRKNEFKLIEEYELGISSDSVLPGGCRSLHKSCVERCRLSDFEGRSPIATGSCTSRETRKTPSHRPYCVEGCSHSKRHPTEPLTIYIGSLPCAVHRLNFVTLPARQSCETKRGKVTEDSYAHAHTIDVATAAPPVGEQNTELSRFTAQTLISEMQLPLPRTSDMQRLTTTVSSLDEVIRLHQRTCGPEKLRS